MEKEEHLLEGSFSTGKEVENSFLTRRGGLGRGRNGITL